MKNKKLLFFLLFVFIDVIIVAVILLPDVFTKPSAQAATETVSVKPVAATILADGSVQAQNQAVLHFQTGGKLTSLPFKEGDSVKAGQTVAQLDTYTLQRQLTAALNTYQSTRDQFDQTQQNANTGVLQSTQQSTLNLQGAGITSNNGTNDYLNGIAKRIVDENQANLDNSVINVEIANYALQLASLTSPIDGVLTNETVTNAGVNVSPTDTFTVSDLSSTVFRANVSETDSNFIQVGAPATITLSGLENKPITGVVSKIYPDKVTLPDGQSVYQVDITSSDLPAYGKLNQAGSVLIQNKFNQEVMLLPAWTVLGNQYVWVLDQNNNPVLKRVTTGETVNDNVEITSGLSDTDRVITNPEVVAKKYYNML